MTISLHPVAMWRIEYAKFRTLHTNAIIMWCTILTCFSIVLSVTLLIWAWDKLPTQVPLWYSKPWGEDRLTSPSWLFLLPGATCIWYIINTLLSIHVTKDHLVFSQILSLSSLLIGSFSFVTLFMIIWIIS